VGGEGSLCGKLYTQGSEYFGHYHTQMYCDYLQAEAKMSDCPRDKWKGD